MDMEDFVRTVRSVLIRTARSANSRCQRTDDRRQMTDDRIRKWENRKPECGLKNYGLYQTSEENGKIVLGYWVEGNVSSADFVLGIEDF